MPRQYNALSVLTSNEKNLVKRNGKGYLIRDRFFELWIARSEKRLQHLVDNAESRFNLELSLS